MNIKQYAKDFLDAALGWKKSESSEPPKKIEYADAVIIIQMFAEAKINKKIKKPKP